MANINFKINDELKIDLENVCDAMGLSVSAVLNICAKQIVKEQGFPFIISAKPNMETLEAMQEAIRISEDKNVKSFKTVDELRKSFDW